MLTRFANEYPSLNSSYAETFAKYRYQIVAKTEGQTVNEVIWGPEAWCCKNFGRLRENDPTCRWNVAGIVDQAQFLERNPRREFEQEIIFLFHDKDDAFLFKMIWG